MKGEEISGRLTAEDVIDRIDTTGKPMLVYRGKSGLVMTGAESTKATQIFADHLDSVIGVYDMACPFRWVKEDLERYGPVQPA